MSNVTSQNFGLAIAYILPGCVSLLALGMVSPEVGDWLRAISTAPAGASIGGFLYLTLAAVMAGLTASTIRWAVVDRLHHLTGIPRPAWDDSKLQEKLGAFGSVVEDHYRYYQFYANMLVALGLLGGARLLQPVGAAGSMRLLDCGIVALAVLYWAGSRDTLRRYYSRANAVLGSRMGSEVVDDQRKRNALPRAGNGADEGQGSHAAAPQGDGPGQAGRNPTDYPRCNEGSPRLVVETSTVRIELKPRAGRCSLL